ncbi:MAG: endonuclease/exonuclease/phosphatase family protein [Geodermatophilaceae bacterium]|nr:endonuclease/exonuclease/phosphatase family protein [Geodermatophilaceae bacterium]MDQ3454036.1 endonuclease/exonuclease/phosphatase family protein [Actinomycetota bacterium]
MTSLFRRTTVLLASTVVAATLGTVPTAGATPAADAAGTVRFATFNASLNRSVEGELVADLSTPDDAQAANVAEIIQRTRPQVLLVNEFDYDAAGEARQLFQDNYLSVPHNGADPIDYPYSYAAPSNTGVPSGFDLNNDGTVGGPDDAFGFGFFPGQFGMAVYSMFPIDTAAVRTFQTFLWKDMPGALLPDDPATPEPADWYSPAELEVFRLSSKSHWDLPVQVDAQTVHFLVSHPTPPVFDGEEDRNGRRNYDEIGFWADYVSPLRSRYVYDDAGGRGGLPAGASFVIAGDQNSDPLDGDSLPGAAQQLLDHPRVNDSRPPDSVGAIQAARLQGGANDAHESPDRHDTADFDDVAPGNLRVDYVLPSADLGIRRSAVFWPVPRSPLYRLVGDGSFPAPSSDHRLVWVDLRP